MNKNAKKQAEKLEIRECAYSKCSNTFVVKKSSLNQKYCKENSGDQDCCRRANFEKYYLQTHGTTEPPPKILEKNKECERVGCTNTFDLKRAQPNKKYCSDECCDIATKFSYEPTGTKLIEKDKKCAYAECENTFDVYSYASNKKYCSDECSKEHHKHEYQKNKSYTATATVSKEKLQNSNLQVTISDELTWQICYVCHESFKGKDSEWCCSDECRKNANRPKLHYDIFNRDGFRCNYCGLSPLTDAGVQLTLDHVRPWARARDDRACNIITCCSTCNSEKGTSLVYNEEEVYKEIAKRNMKHGIDPDTIVSASTKHRKF